VSSVDLDVKDEKVVAAFFIGDGYVKTRWKIRYLQRVLTFDGKGFWLLKRPVKPE
jgi:hypothetical protein